jgi:hypothetical protein
MMWELIFSRLLRGRAGRIQNGTLVTTYSPERRSAGQWQVAGKWGYRVPGQNSVVSDMPVSQPLSKQRCFCGCQPIAVEAKP